MQKDLSQLTEKKKITDSSITQFLTFDLSHKVYGVNLIHVREIIDYGNITTVPMMPNFIAGVINLRGSVVTVIDLALRFNVSTAVQTKRSSIVIVEVEYEEELFEIGITVDAVDEVLDITSRDIEPTPSFGTSIRTDFISGMAKVNNQILVLLDIEKVLDIEELSSLEMAG